MAEIFKIKLKGDEKAGVCRGCGAGIFWYLTKKEKWMPTDPDGTPHWATCPNAKDFKHDK